jgi:hypothetical protein
VERCCGNHLQKPARVEKFFYKPVERIHGKCHRQQESFDESHETTDESPANHNRCTRPRRKHRLIFFFNAKSGNNERNWATIKTDEDSYQGVAGNQSIASQNALAWVETNTSL